jgi:hypothetical protein
VAGEMLTEDNLRQRIQRLGLHRPSRPRYELFLKTPKIYDVRAIRLVKKAR